MSEQTARPGRDAGELGDQAPIGSGPTPADTPVGGPADGQPDGVRVTLRRAPKFGPFTLTGAAIGVLLGIIASVSTAGQDGQFSGRTALGYLCALGLLFGGLVGAGVAVLVDRRH